MAGASPGMTRAFVAPVSKARGLIALRALHAVGDQLVRVDAFRRLHAFRRISYDVDDLRLLLLLVESVGAVGGLGDALMAVAARKLDVAGRPLELDALDRGGDLVGRRL